MNGRYILDGREPKPVVSVIEWARWYEANAELACRVGSTHIAGARVSTVFLALDHNHFGEGPPLLFETLIMGGPLNGEMRRCSTWAEAEALHDVAVKRAKEAVS